ncbi:MAG: type II CRISPR-associated endonuclease Cas1 [bacterium]|uniref:CRISPR-associated endonuclease Cas1 n=2 Tax=Bacteria candidate phyla TaxID=1783234 RepID=A0A101I1J5_UNCT6|nr:MAG: CRISPR-associated protein Cas1 [candidate division TA06 bacterium 32_111]KUK86533.1 MAG: CRISPR-associated protein Cas1 [candidate division TA06 bacterium 34_109]MDI6700733.1 type II CRISPR-associated endonuclease Cas1 [bacterium]HAF07882.1 type II CRISPR-associated endonuclease Cas1 [candidate division WOR-3 bacterium]HCP16416.1 type II CRISPR-associated endonuclease Cas1 [candidate division WOR-3 bacterium]
MTLKEYKGLEKIIEISEGPVKLNSEYEQLIITKNDEKIGKIPINEISVLLITTPIASISTNIISLITKNKGMIVVCDQFYLPVGVFLPYELNYIQQERFNKQINASLPLKKQLWKQLISAKIKSQGAVLKKIREFDFGLNNIAEKVLSGDASNLESYASRIYFKKLFGDKFKREKNLPGINSILNYGYTILRAMTSRAICSSGLNPTLGIFHHNKYNSFCLADDLMEPYRPIVDELIYNFMIKSGIQLFLTKDLKRNIIKELLNKKFEIDKDKIFLNEALFRLSSSLVEVYCGKEKKLKISTPYEKERDKNSK